ncbi:MAG: amidase [Proteobacteria bacterium]|nr:amidase [Pseudomonadota bacterium]
MRERDASARAAVARSLARIGAREAEVRAWTVIDHDGAAAQAAAIDRGDRPLPLAGLTLGVKDIIDVGGLPCECGSPVFRGRRAFSDAAVVSRLKSLGMVVLGKTTTTECAYLAPTQTRNPWNVAYSPGGSSSGSAAAVADGHVDAALGTQTAGSILRPAAFCGVLGYKPTFGWLSRAGALSTSPSLDTMGWISKDAETSIRIRKALTGSASAASAGGLGFCRTVHWPKAEAAMQQGLERLAHRLSAPEVPAMPAHLDAVHATIMRHEMREELATLRLQHADHLSRELGALLGDTPPAYVDYKAAIAARNEIDIEALFAGMDVLLLPAAPGGAVPFGSTGDPCFNRAATLLGLPAVSLPFGLGADGLPLGVQLIARQDQDDMLLATALHVQQRVAFDHRPI